MRPASRFSLLLTLVCAAFVLGGADGCSSDPNVEGAKGYLRNGDYATAIERLDVAITTNPDNTEAHALRAEVLRQQAERERSATARRPMVEQMVISVGNTLRLEPAHPAVVVTRGNAWVKEMNDGIAVLRASGDDAAALGNAVAAFENATLIQPDSGSGHYNLGLAHLAAGNAQAAIPALERAVALGDADVSAYVYLSRAQLATENGTGAIATLERARAQFPDDRTISAELLNAYAASGQADRALTEYQSALARDPDNALLRYNYGSTLLQARRFDDAVTQFTRAVELDPTNANAQYNLGAAYQNKAAAVSAQLLEATDNSRADAFRAERDALLQQALSPLREARRLTEASGESPREVCEALFRVYVTLDRPTEAQEAGGCAGMNMN